MLKSIIRFSMKNSVALILLIVIVVGAGVYSLREINIEKYPNIDIPYLTVVIPYPGASPEQAMKDIGEPVERELMNVDGVKNVYTDGVANVVYITSEFDLSTDMKDAEQVVKSAIDKVPLPESAEKPEFFLQGPEPDPTVFSIGIYAEQDQENLQAYVKDKIIPQLESIEGVSKVEAGGVQDSIIYIRLLPDELQAKGLLLDDVKGAIQANNLSIPSGEIEITGQKLPVRVNNELNSIEEIKDITLFGQGALTVEQIPQLETIKLGDIAEVTYESENASNITRINGKPGVSLGIIVERGANVVAIVDEVKDTIDNLNMPIGFEAETLRDQSIEIKQSVYSMLREAVLGAIMAVLVTLLFLRNLRSTIIAILSIPLSILASFTVLNMLGYTLNIMTLSGIAVAVGRVVDDSIVVIENVFRRVRTAKERDASLVEKSTREVASAITSSTITTVAVFLPMAFVPGIVGRFFAPLAWTVVVSLLFSLLVAITIVPLFSRMFLLNIKPAEHKEGAMQKVYRKSLKWALEHRAITLLVSIVILASSVILIAPRLGTTFLPQEKANNYDVRMTLEKGTSPEETSEAASKVEEILLASEDIERVSTSVDGNSESALISFTVDESVADVDGYIKDLRDTFEEMDGPKEISVSAVGSFAGGAESQFVLVVNGTDFADIELASNEIVNALKDVNGMAEVKSSLEGDEPEIELQLNDAKLAEHGLMPAMVGKGLRELIKGDVVTSIYLDEDKTDVNLSLKMEEVSSLEELGEQKIKNMFGVPVALKDIGELKNVTNRNFITHLNGNEYVMVFGQITSSKTGEVTKQADDAIAKLDLPEGVEYYKEGASAAMEEGFKNLAIAIAVSIIIVYMVMVISFGEGRAPFVILFAIPFSIIGALIGLYIVGEPIGMPSMIGLLMLNGIVVTNAIVLLDKVKHNERDGYAIHEAIVEAGAVRLRPILMTAIATIGALIPMAVSSHAGIVSSSLAVVVIGGLFTSTLLTLFIVPVLYSLFHPKEKKKKKKEKGIQVQAG